MIPIRAPKDFWSGVMFIVFAAAALIAAHGYSLGSAGKMGPGYFPIMLGIALSIIGAILMARSFGIDGEPIGSIHLKPLAIVTASVILFGLMIEPLGLVIALIAAVLVAAWAGRESKLWESLALVVVLAAFSVGIFVVALRLPLPVWPAFLS